VAAFSADEIRYLTSERLLGRLATIQPDGMPHVVPVGWSFNADRRTIDISGRNFAASRKFKNVKANPNVAFVVDDVLPPWRPRSVMVQGRAETIDASGTEQATIRIVPDKIVSWGMDEDLGAAAPNS